MSNIIKYSQLFFDSEYIKKIRKQTAGTPKADDVFVENDKNATPKEIFDAYTEAFSLYPTSVFNSDLGKKWQQNPENTDGDSKFKMPSNEHILVGDKQKYVFADEDGKYYCEEAGKFIDREKIELDRLKKANEEIKKKKQMEEDRLKTANGKIEDFEQGPIESCWANFGIEAIAKFNNNSEIKKCMKKNTDGSWTVTFRGVKGKPQFTVIPEEFSAQENLHLSSGDPDMKILEIATRKLIKSDLIPEIRDKQNQAEPLRRGFDYEMFKYLLDKDEFEIYGFNSEKFQENKNRRNITPNKLNGIFNILEKLNIKMPMTVGTVEDSQDSFVPCEKLSGKLEEGHAYSIEGLGKTEVVQYDGGIKKHTEKAVFLRNQDGKGKINISRKEFFKNMGFFSIAMPTKKHELFKTCDENNTSDICKDYQTLQELRKKLEEE